MSPSLFPDPQTADKSGLVVVSDYIDANLLIDAYANGIFPWPMQDHSGLIPWFSPAKRGVLFLNEVHIPTSLRKIAKRSEFTFSINKAFSSVIGSCANINRTGENSTWITPMLIDAYTSLHARGHAYSVETWDGDGQLVGGLYGVQIGRFISGESMFFTKPNASKLALMFLIQFCETQGIEWIDCQVLNSNTERFGARSISRKRFLSLLQEVLQNSAA